MLELGGVPKPNDELGGALNAGTLDCDGPKPGTFGWDALPNPGEFEGELNPGAEGCELKPLSKLFDGACEPKPAFDEPESDCCPVFE